MRTADFADRKQRRLRGRCGHRIEHADHRIFIAGLLLAIGVGMGLAGRPVEVIEPQLRPYDPLG